MSDCVSVGTSSTCSEMLFPSVCCMPRIFASSLKRSKKCHTQQCKLKLTYASVTSLPRCHRLRSLSL